MGSNGNGAVGLSSHSLTAPSLYPVPSIAALIIENVGRQIKNAQAPAAIIDTAVVRRNCMLMLEAARKLDLAFRAHVKTHKVRILVGTECDD